MYRDDCSEESLTGDSYGRQKGAGGSLRRQRCMGALLGAALLLVVLLTGLVVLLVMRDKGMGATSRLLEERQEVIIVEEGDSHPGSHFDNSIDYDVLSEDEKERLNSRMNAKIEQNNQAFARRYPRADPYRSSAAAASRRLIHNLPRPLRQVSDSRLTPAQKVSEIYYSLDEDGDGVADAWELHDWIIWVEKIFHRHTLEEQWASFGRSADGELTWSDYQHMLYPHGIKNLKDKRRAVKDRRRWTNADSDASESLTKHEFKYFIFPHMSDSSGEVLIPEAHDDLDTDMDGRVSLEEFLDAHVEDEDDDEKRDFTVEIRYFNHTLDKDLNGFLDVEELAAWVEPEGFSQAMSEVVYLMESLDVATSGTQPRDKLLSREEVLADGGKIFLTSEATYFGQIYKLENLRDEVFQVKRKEEA